MFEVPLINLSIIKINKSTSSTPISKKYLVDSSVNIVNRIDPTSGPV